MQDPRPNMKPDTGRQREVQVLLVWVAGSRFGAPSPAQPETVAGARTLQRCSGPGCGRGPLGFPSPSRRTFSSGSKSRVLSDRQAWNGFGRIATFKKATAVVFKHQEEPRATGE